MNSPLPPVLFPAPIVIIVLSVGGNNGCIDSVAVLTVTAFDWSCMVTVLNSARSRLWKASSLRNLTKAVRSGAASIAENPQKRRKEARSSSASASFTSDRSHQMDRSRALDIAKGSRIERIEQYRGRLPPISDNSASSDEAARSRPAKPNYSCPIEHRATCRPPSG